MVLGFHFQPGLCSDREEKGKKLHGSVSRELERGKAVSERGMPHAQSSPPPAWGWGRGGMGVNKRGAWVAEEVGCPQKSVCACVYVCARAYGEGGCRLLDEILLSGRAPAPRRQMPAPV